MEPVIIDRTQHHLSRKDIAPEALRVLYRLNEAGYLGYLAGGGVRDLLLRRTPKDFDVVTNAQCGEMKKLFRNSRLIGRRFRLVHVFFPGRIVEVATFRAPPCPEEQVQPGQQFLARDGLILRDNVYGTPEEDAFRRDFTVNAMFYNIADYSIIDYTGGLQDLEARCLRMVGEPAARIREDPVRMLRAVRFAATLDFQIEPQALAAIRELGGLLKLSSRERMYDEMLKFMFCGHVERGFRILMDLGLFPVIFPAWAAWLAAEGDAAQTWVFRALRQIDIWKRAGMLPHEPLLWALLLGGYHESLAAQQVSQGVNVYQALDQATHRQMKQQDILVYIPHGVVQKTAEIMKMQALLRLAPPRRAARLPQRVSFKDGLVYLKFSSRMDPSRAAALERWTHPPARRHPDPAPAERTRPAAAANPDAGPAAAPGG